MPTATFISHSAAETESLGAQFGRSAERGLVIALNGELGAGKTQFAPGPRAGQPGPGAFADVYAGQRIRRRAVEIVSSGFIPAGNAGTDFIGGHRGLSAAGWRPGD